MIKFTRLGKSFLFATLISLFGAATSGNNLLYILFSTISSILIISFFLNRLNFSGIEVTAFFPEQIFQNARFKLQIFLSKKGIMPSLQIYVVSALDRKLSSQVRKNITAEIVIDSIFKARGINRFTDLYLESDFPFGLFVRRREIKNISGTAFPALFEIYGAHTFRAVTGEKQPKPKRGTGDEFYGIREYTAGEDVRLINWKLTAKTGTPLVKEYARMADNRVIITVGAGTGENAEAAIREAASLAKFFIDSGIEVKLVTGEGEIGYGTGLIQLDIILNKLSMLGTGKQIKDTGAEQKKPVLAEKEYFPGSALGIAYITTAFVFSSLFLVEDISPVFLSAIAPIIPLSLFLDIKNIRLIPKLFFGALSALFLLFVIFFDFPSTGILLATTHLVLYILLFLLLNPKTESSMKQIFLVNFMIFFLVSGQTINLWYFLFFVIYIFCAFWWLIQWKDKNSLMPKLFWARGIAALAGIVICVSAFTFMATPREDNPRMRMIIQSAGFNRLTRASRSFTGLTENVKLGYFGGLQKNTSRVMRITVLDQNGKPHKSARELRVRGGAFDFFDGIEWKKSFVDFDCDISGKKKKTQNSRLWLSSARDNFIIFPGFEAKKPAAEAEFYVYPINSSLLFTVAEISAVEAPVSSLSLDFTDTKYFPAANIMGMRYKIYSQKSGTSFYRDINNYELLLKKYYLQNFESTSKYKKIAETFSASAESQMEKAKAIESRFRNDFNYSLSAKYGTQDLDGFFESKTGNCEYFASGMCVLLRSVNIPCRLAVGFLTYDWNEYGKFYDVRQSDAHAWVEAYFPETGWMVFDPTPPESLLSKQAGTIFARFDRYFNAVQLKWYRYVIGYDNYTRRNYFYRFSLNLKKNLLIKILTLFASLVLTVLFIVLAPGLIKMLYSFKKIDKNEYFYYKILSQLEKRGFRRKAWQTPRDFVAGIVLLKPELNSLSKLTRYFYILRYSGAVLNGKELHNLKEISDTVISQIKRLK